MVPEPAAMLYSTATHFPAWYWRESASPGLPHDLDEHHHAVANGRVSLLEALMVTQLSCQWEVGSFNLEKSDTNLVKSYFFCVTKFL